MEQDFGVSIFQQVPKTDLIVLINRMYISGLVYLKTPYGCRERFGCKQYYCLLVMIESMSLFLCKIRILVHIVQVKYLCRSD